MNVSVVIGIVLMVYNMEKRNTPPHTQTTLQIRENLWTQSFFG